MQIENNPAMQDMDSPKARLIMTAYKLFGERDPSDVSVRQIAKEADVNIASIAYHFGSKDGLYLQVIDMIAEGMKEKIDRFRVDLLERKEKFALSVSNEKDMQLFYIESVKTIIEHGARVMLETMSKSNFMHRIMVREQMTPGAGFPILFEKALQHLFSIVDDLISYIDTSSPEAIITIRSHSIYGQIVVFVCTHGTINKRLGSENYSQECIEEIIAVVKEHTGYILKSFIQED